MAEENEDAKRRRQEAAAAAILLLASRQGSKARKALSRAAAEASRLGLPLLKAEEKVSGAVRGAVLAARQAGKKASRSVADFPKGHPYRGGPEGPADRDSAMRVGASVAGRWRERVEKLAAESGADPENLYGEVAASSGWDAERAAANEAMVAWNAEVREAAEIQGWSREWVAVLDKETCAACWALHGTVVGPGEDFPEGDPPLHVRCRCYVDVV